MSELMFSFLAVLIFGSLTALLHIKRVHLWFTDLAHRAAFGKSRARCEFCNSPSPEELK